jgi:hypothetical protein
MRVRFCDLKEGDEFVLMGIRYSMITKGEKEARVKSLYMAGKIKIFGSKNKQYVDLLATKTILPDIPLWKQIAAKITDNPMWSVDLAKEFELSLSELTNKMITVKKHFPVKSTRYKVRYVIYNIPTQ